MFPFSFMEMVGMFDGLNAMKIQNKFLFEKDIKECAGYLDLNLKESREQEQLRIALSSQW